MRMFDWALIAQEGLVEGDSLCVLPPVCNVECIHGLDCTPLLQ